MQTNQTDLKKKPIGFKNWIGLTYGKQDSFYFNNPKMFRPQSDWITDQDGNPLVDFICRFENLNDDFDEVCRKIGKTVKLPHVRATERGHYKEYHDQETIDIIANWYRKDIDKFRYSY